MTLELTPLSLPLHPLVVHAAVVLIPLAALLAAAFVLRPGWRYLLRIPTALCAAGALVVLFVTRQTGDALAHATPDHKALIEKHDHLAGLLTITTIPLVALALLACWSMPSVSGLVSGRGAREARRERLHPVLTLLTVLLAIAVLVLTVLTGHSGATAAWSS